MELAFYLAVLFVIFIDLKDLINVKSLLDRRFMMVEVNNMDIDELANIDNKTKKEIVIQEFETYFYFGVMIVGLFSSQLIFFAIMIAVTLVSAFIAKRLENDKKKFTTYFMFDKVISIVILSLALINKYMLITL